MTKNELARELADDFELPRRQLIEIVEAMLERITQVLKSGDKVQLTPFGQFKVRDRPARVARNPQTGAPVNVPAKRVLKFIAGRALKEAVGTAKRGGEEVGRQEGAREEVDRQEGARAQGRTGPQGRSAGPQGRRKEESRPQDGCQEAPLGNPLHPVILSPSKDDGAQGDIRRGSG